MAGNIDDKDIFDLMGLAHLPAPEKEAYLSDMNAQIWEEFVMRRLKLMLTQADWQELENMQNEAKSTEAVLSYISEKIPNLGELVFEFSRQIKIDLIAGQFNLVITDISELIKTAAEEEKLHLQRKQEKYQMAKNLLHSQQWDELEELMKDNKSS